MTKSEDQFQLALQAIPGGVNSPVRAFKSVGGKPVFIEKAKGAYIFDVDGNKYIDFVGSWGPMILGHAHDDVIDAVKLAADKGLSFGAPTEIETILAQKIKDIYPSIDLVRMVNSGTEATMSAIRLARGYTQRDKIIKFAGCYHGHVDSLLVASGSGALTLGVPTSPGIPEAVVNDTVVLEYNNCEQIKQVFADIGSEIAGVIVEPVAGNMNCVIPDIAFLQCLRDLCDDNNSILIFDEVMTGFRVALGGAQQLLNIKPDLTTLGKIVGGGMPVGAFGGKQEIMESLAPNGAVYQAGTLSGNPLAMTAGLSTLNLISQPGFYQQLNDKTESLVKGIKQVALDNSIKLTFNQIGGMFGLFFSDQEKIKNFTDVDKCDLDIFNQFFTGMLKHGVYLAPSAFEAGFVSSAHSEDDIQRTIEVAELVFSKIK